MDVGTLQTPLGALISIIHSQLRLPIALFGASMTSICMATLQITPQMWALFRYLATFTSDIHPSPQVAQLLFEDLYNILLVTSMHRHSSDHSVAHTNNHSSDALMEIFWLLSTLQIKDVPQLNLDPVFYPGLQTQSLHFFQVPLNGYSADKTNASQATLQMNG
jgi:hypothetical protein